MRATRAFVILLATLIPLRESTAQVGAVERAAATGAKRIAITFEKQIAAEEGGIFNAITGAVRQKFRTMRGMTKTSILETTIIVESEVAPRYRRHLASIAEHADISFDVITKAHCMSLNSSLSGFQPSLREEIRFLLTAVGMSAYESVRYHTDEQVFETARQIFAIGWDVRREALNRDAWYRAYLKNVCNITYGVLGPP